jgi:hypothetical protein
MRLPCGCYELLSTTHYLLPIQPGRPAFCFYGPEFPKAQQLRAASTWWTGEDSNLRSPQGAADLQSAGFSHSPTRPRKFVPHAKCKSSKHLSENAAGTGKNTKRTRVKRHQPVDFVSEDSLRLIPPQADRWSWRRELNPRPSDYKSDALPAELRQRSQTDKE